MKVLFHSWEFGPGTGGIGQYLYQMALGLTRLGHGVVVASGRVSGMPEEEETEYGRIFRCYDREEVRSVRVSERVLGIAGEYGVDIIEGTDHWGECARLIGMKERPPVLIKYHGCQIIDALTSAEVVYPWQHLTVAMALLRIRRQRRAERICVEEADLAAAPSEKIRRDYLDQGTRIPAQFAIIPNIFSSPVTPAWGEEAPVPTLFFAGRLELRKGVQHLPVILGEVLKHFPDAVLELAGSDSYARGVGSVREWLRKRFGSLASHVRFLGPLKGDDLARAYGRCQVFVFPTKWDNFPMVILEAMARGKAIVTTPHGGMPEMLGGTGSPIVEPSSPEFAAAVCRLLADGQERRRIGEANLRKVREYTPERVIPQYIRFVESHLP